MTNEINHLHVYIPRREDNHPKTEKFFKIISCIKNLIDPDPQNLGKSYSIVDDDGRWHTVRVRMDFSWQNPDHVSLLGELHTLGCKAWVDDCGDMKTYESFLLAYKDSPISTVRDLFKTITPKEENSMINKTNYHLRIYIPKLGHDHPETDGNRFVGIVKCIRGITRIGLKDAKNIVDADNQWHRVPIYKHQDSEWDLDGERVFIDKLNELGCSALVEREEVITIMPNEQDYMDTLGSLMEGATPKKEADTIVDLKHYILMAINLKQYKMAKYLIDNLAQYEE